MDWLLFLIGLMTALGLVASLLPFVPLPHGIFRVGEFPRVQILVWSLVALLLTLALLPWHGDGSGWTWAFVLVNLVSIGVQLWFIRSFTPLSRHRVRDFVPEDHPADTPLVRMLAANVKLSNRDYDRLCALVMTCDPDIAVFMEVDDEWIRALDAVTADYPHRIVEAQDNGYGMMLVSRAELVEHEIKHLLNPEVPSFHCTVRLGPQDTFRLVALHPEPPSIKHDTIGRDAEIGMVGLEMRERDEAAVVFGDLNDVAWSATTRRFLRLSRMLDPRHGRGQFNSFDARYPFARWPLDHIFVTPHFEIVGLRRMPHIGSDHFPMFYELALTDREAARVEDDPATEDDFEDVDELVETERGRERRPVGVDWEDED